MGSPTAPKRLECNENKELIIPGGVTNVRRAWYGDPSRPWREQRGIGVGCTDLVVGMIRKYGKAQAVNSKLGGDPAPGVLKKLLVELNFPDIKVLKGREGEQMLVPGGADSVLRAWYGDRNNEWHVSPAVGLICTDIVRHEVLLRGTISVTNETFGMDPDPGPRKVLLVEVLPTVRIFECSEGESLFIPGGADNVLRAWYGDPKYWWQETVGKLDGKMCTEQVQDALRTGGKVVVHNDNLDGDPCPGVSKKLLVQVKSTRLQITVVAEGRVFKMAHPASIERAWYGDERHPWQIEPGIGKDCTAKVIQLVRLEGQVAACNVDLEGDPAPGVRKILLVETGSFSIGLDSQPSSQARQTAVDFDANGTVSDGNAQKCVICLSSPSTHAFIPCGHRCVCGDCSITVVNRPDASCPVCRLCVAQVVQIYT